MLHDGIMKCTLVRRTRLMLIKLIVKLNWNHKIICCFFFFKNYVLFSGEESSEDIGKKTKSRNETFKQAYCNKSLVTTVLYIKSEINSTEFTKTDMQKWIEFKYVKLKVCNLIATIGTIVSPNTNKFELPISDCLHFKSYAYGH